MITACNCERYNFTHAQEPGRCLVPSLPPTRMVDQFGFPIPQKETFGVSREDLELTKRFLGNLKDQTLSRGIHKVLSDLLERLP